MYYVYVLLSEKDGRCYVGRTSNLANRLRRHAEGFVQSTSHRRPLRLVHWEEHPDVKAAAARERCLKSPEATSFKESLRSERRESCRTLPQDGDVAQLGER